MGQRRCSRVRLDSSTHSQAIAEAPLSFQHTESCGRDETSLEASSRLVESCSRVRRVLRASKYAPASFLVAVILRSESRRARRVKRRRDE